MLEFFVTRLYDQGRPVPKHVSTRLRVRGALSVREEHVDEHHRMVRVARLQVAASQAKSAPPPLYDVALLGASTEWWTLTGFERLTTGPLNEAQCFVQTWLMSLAPVEDLIALERRFDALSGELATLRGNGRHAHE